VPPAARPAAASAAFSAGAAPAAEAAGCSRRNYMLGILNGTLGTVAYDFIHPDLILAGLVFALARPVYGEEWAFFLVSVLSIINKGGSLLPQLYVSSMLEHRPKKRPFYGLLTVIRAAGTALLLVSMWLLASHVHWTTLTLFFGAFLIIAVCMGAGHVITLDMFGRMIRMDRIGAFLGTREFWGGAFSFVAGLFIVQPILNRGQGGDNAALASSYFWLGVIGGTLTIIAMLALLACHEEAGPRAKRRTTLMESLIRGWRWLKRNRNYRAYFWLRVAFRINDLSMTFFIPYGATKLKTAGDTAGVVVLGGLLVATFKISRVCSSALWGWTVDRYGDRATLVWTGVCFVLAPLLALAAPLMPATFGVTFPGTKVILDLPLAVYLLALAAIGTAYQGSIIGGNRFLIGRAPPRRRLSYIGFLNTITSPLTFLPLVGAAVAAHWGVTTLFVAIIGGGLLYLVWAVRIRPEAKILPVRRGGATQPEPAEGGP
jgi:hypothetical protein